MFNSLFKIVYFVLFMVIAVVRKYHTAKYFKQELKDFKKAKNEWPFLVFAGIGMVIPLFYVFSSKLDFADYYLPQWVGWLGAVVFVFAIWLLHRTHVDLDRQWTFTPNIRKNHKLITKGVFKYIRHPMYAAHLLWAIAQIMLLHNWIAGWSFLATFAPLYFYRVANEEKMMIKEFGDEYKEYMKKTGRILPRFNK